MTGDTIMAVETAANSSPPRTVLKRKIGSGNEARHLQLMMLGCEDQPPYGPTDHTGALFLDLVCKSLQELTPLCWIVSITIYQVKQLDYPATTEEWDSYDGIILPGSFSCAYDTIDWIDKLRHVITEQVYGRPTLGICFGHQIFAHAFSDGQAIKCPAGAQAGRKCFALTQEGQEILSTKNLQLYYTHGDMVETLPSCAISLGGTEQVPILAAAYYRSENKGNTRPVAITFQAHPEYASPELGLHKTLSSILSAMEQRGEFSSEKEESFRRDAVEHYNEVERDSIQLMKKVGMLLGWFPED